MRTTISMDDRLAEQVKRQASRFGLSFSAYVARTLDDALKRQEPRSASPFRLITVGGTGVKDGVDLDHPRALVLADDEVTFGRGTDR